MTFDPLLGPGRLTLILVRHGLTDLTGRLLNGSGPHASDPDLNSFGRVGVERLREQTDIQGLLRRVHATWSSPARRAVATAELLMGQAPQSDPRLEEVSFGDWEGRSLEAIWHTEPDLAKKWSQDPNVAPPGGTSVSQAAQRVLAWREERLAEVDDGEHVVALVAGHATSVRILIADALGLTLDNITRIAVLPASVSVVNFWADGGSSLELLIPTPRPNG